MDRESRSAAERLTRRQFGMLAAGSAAALTLPGCACAPGRTAELTHLPYAPGDATPVVAAGVPRGASAEATERAVRSVAEAATDFDWLSRGDSVLLKPVCNSGYDYPATTDPVAVRAMVRLLRERGAGRVILADMSGVQFLRFSPDETRGSTRALLQKNGIAAAAEDAGAEVHAFEEAGWDGFFAEEPRVGDHWRGALTLPSLLRETDHVILMPRCARHLIAGTTLGLKAAVGWWRHDTRLEYHRDAGDFAAKTADASTLPTLEARQRLVLTSATKVLTTLGPDQGWISEPETGLVYASTDVVAHDMLSLAWLVENRARMPRGEREGVFDDPHTSGVFVNAVNRMVVRWLGGFGAMLGAQGLARFDLHSIWDDPVLHRAFQTRGGVPRLELADADGSLPGPLRALLDQRITRA
jgi:uncharacterized protein (DUF362 family)